MKKYYPTLHGRLVALLYHSSSCASPLYSPQTYKQIGLMIPILSISFSKKHEKSSVPLRMSPLKKIYAFVVVLLLKKHSSLDLSTIKIALATL